VCSPAGQSDLDEHAGPSSRRSPVDEGGATPGERQQVPRRARETCEDPAAPDERHNHPPACESLRHVPAVREVDLDDTFVSAPAKSDSLHDKSPHELPRHTHSDDDPDPYANGDTRRRGGARRQEQERRVVSGPSSGRGRRRDGDACRSRGSHGEMPRRNLEPGRCVAGRGDAGSSTKIDGEPRRLCVDDGRRGAREMHRGRRRTGESESRRRD
jgi:hypothetical protein